jgi:peptidoglycan/LPS O-acetylase OafA/YrhL
MEEKRALLPLTSLRFVAAAMIVVHHGLPAMKLLPLPLSLDQGVSFFFVLSGFILTYSYPSLRTWMEVRRFLIFRIARVWPAHAVTTIAAVIIFQLPIEFKIIANLAMVHAWVPNWPWYFSYNTVSWSISTEFFFYLAFPFLIIGWSRTFWWKFLLCAALLWALMIAGRELNLPDITVADTASLHGLLYISPLARLLEFVAGMTTCLAFRWTLPQIGTRPTWLFTVLEIAALIFAGWFLASHILWGSEMRLLPSTASEYLGHADSWPGVVPVIFVFAFQKGAISRMLSLKPFLLLGETSYSLYLVHYMTFGVIIRSLGITGIAGFALGCAASLVLAFALWRLVERPARRTIRKINWMSSAPTHPAIVQPPLS